jgi:MFS family permease
MVFFHEHSHTELDKILHDRMSKLYLFQAIMTFVKSMIGIFVPVYFYSLGYSIIQICFYSMGLSIIYLLMIPLTTKIIKKIGFKFTILLSVPLYYLHIISLTFVSEISSFFILACLSFGLYLSIFWPAMHCEIAANGSNKSRGSQIGTMQILSTSLAALSPLIGGFILQYLDYSYFLIFSTIFIFIGILPLVLSKDIKVKKYEFKYSGYLKLIKNKQLSNSKIAFASEGIENFLSLFFWPIILFIILKENFFQLGLLFTFVSILSIALILVIKKKLDRSDRNKTLKIITKLLSLNWFFRSFLLLASSIMIYFVETFFKLIKTAYSLSFVSIFYNNAKKNKFMDYIILRELYLHSTKIIFLSLVILILTIFGESILVLSSIILVGVLSPLGLSYFKEE